MNNPVKTLVVVFLITLIVFVGVATLPVQADAATIAFYRPYITGNTGLLLYNTPDYVSFTPNVTVVYLVFDGKTTIGGAGWYFPD